MIENLIILIPALPLAATLMTAVLGKRVLKENSHWPIVLAFAGSCVLSLIMLSQVRQEMAAAGEGAANVGWEKTVNLWNWVNIPDAIAAPPEGYVNSAVAVPGEPNSKQSTDKPAQGTWAKAQSLPFRIDVTLRVDPLTTIMLCMVTFISTLVAIYASGYMHGDPGYWRFFTYIGLFVFSMTMLVSVSNFVLLYVFWEAVGACSYLLIGFWFEKPEAAAAGKKAFLVNRVGDFCFALALFLIWSTYGTLNFHDADGVAGVLGQHRLAGGLFVGGTLATAICVLLMGGACGKSAQFPLHVWLPDAMEGPTPVSALIHAATMVTAGVYMVTRCTPLFIQNAVAGEHGGMASEAQQVVAVLGTITLALAGIIAVTQTDLKRVLAYSTVSQLGYMFLGLGTGSIAGIAAGMFHLFTHAFFKALLFLGAGSVMHAMGGIIDMRQFGGLRRLMPKTHWTFLFGSLALAGVIPFAGFWSKDAIMAAVHERAHDNVLFETLYYVALATAFLTAMYTFRAYFLTFHGPERVPPEAGHHAHESPANMTIPLMILAVGALGVGAFFAGGEMLWHGPNGFVDFLIATPSLAFKTVRETGEASGFHPSVAAVSTGAALAGIGLAAFLYLGDRRQAAWLAQILRPAYLLSHGKFFIDQIYQLLIVLPLWLLSLVCYWFDRFVIDGLVNFFGKVPVAIGSVMRSLQTGMVQFYALAMILGLLVLIGTLLM
jgi:NADH-quinone oxidoreductase subunit L